jgi:flagellar biosynthesis protein FliR
MIELSSTQFDGWLGQFFWPMIRILALIAVAPVLGNRVVPVRVKVALAILVTICASPVLPAPPNVALDSYAGFALIAREILIGISLGFAVRIVFAAIELAGEIVGLQMGLSFAGYIDPVSGGTGNAISRFFGTISVLMFLAINGHLLLLYGVIESFHALPISLDGSFLTEGKRIALAGSDLFRIGLTIALPFILLMLLVNLAMGVISRVAPQLNVFAIGFPITMIVGLVALVLIMPYLANPITAALERSLAAVGGYR